MGSNAPGGWPEEHHTALVDFIAAGLTFEKAAAAINERFNTFYTRNALIGRAGRTGIVKPAREKVAPAPKKPKVCKPRPSRAKPERTFPFNPPPSPAEITLRCAEVAPRHLSLLELQAGDCRYPYGDDHTFTFCGLKAEPDKPYCRAHFDLCRKGKDQ